MSRRSPASWRDESRMGGHGLVRDGRPLEPRLRLRDAPPEKAANSRFIGIRHEGAAAFAASAYGEADRPSGRLLGPARPRAPRTFLTGLWDARKERRRTRPRDTGPGAARCSARVRSRSSICGAAFGTRRVEETVQAGSDHARALNLACTRCWTTAVESRFPTRCSSRRPRDAAGAPTGRHARDEHARPADRYARSSPAVKLLDGAPAGHRAGTARVRQPAYPRSPNDSALPVMTTFKRERADPRRPSARRGCWDEVARRSRLDDERVRAAARVPRLVLNHTGIANAGQARRSTSTSTRSARPYDDVMRRSSVTCGGRSRRLLEERRRPGHHDQIRRTKVGALVGLWAQRRSGANDKDSGARDRAAAVFAAMSRQAPGEAISTVNVGDNTYSFGRYLESTRTGRSSCPDTAHSIGFGYPAAIGAWWPRTTPSP